MKYDIKNLTLDEKIRLLAGIDFWRLYSADGKLPEVFLSDGPNGLRMHDLEKRETKKATAMPNLSLVSCTWDTELAYLDGETIAEDCAEMGADVLLAPGVNIKRTPLCGRNFEYLSEDPYLAGVMAKAYIEGVQSKGIGTSLKHYCANNREYDRLSQTSEVDERTLREIYLTPFEIAVQAQPWTVMCSYNPINGVYASENKKLLLDVLRGEFGFDGVIVSDWDAVHSSWRAVKAGVDLEMPYRKEAYGDVKNALEKGWITEAEIDARVENVLRLIEKKEKAVKKVTTTKAERHERAVQIAREGMVLLKNEDGILPLKDGKISVTGIANRAPVLGGGGSAFVQTAHQDIPLSDLLAEKFGENATVSTTTKAAMTYRDPDFVWYIKDSYQTAYGKDVAVVCVGTGQHVETEGRDRMSLRLSEPQETLILNTAKVNPNVVVVVYGGSAIDMSAWIDKVKAVLWAGFAGEGGPEAVADILTGEACPCGKLTETFPLCLEDTPTGREKGNGFVERYSEGLFVGYRWYDAYEKEVLFPFGYGLSYAKFEYSDLKIQKESETDYEISFQVKNVSSVDGKEIAQVYVKDVFAMVTRPEKELKGFAKVALKAGESKTVRIKLNARSFAYYNKTIEAWYVENGAFEVLVGASSRDIRLAESIEICLPENEQYTQM